MLSKNLATFRGALLGGVVILTLLASTLPILPYGIGSGDGAFALLMLLVMTYLFDITYHGVGKSEVSNKICILLRLFYKGLSIRKRKNITDVKGYYTNEQYDWITDTKFPEKILHDRRRDTMAKRARVYITRSEILDLGCGTGLITQMLPGNVTGVDISPWKVERARRHCPRATFIVGDAENISELPTNNSFDAVVCTDVLEHLEAPDKAVAEARRLLKPGGIFIGTVPSRHIIWKFRRFLTTADASGEPFHVHYTKKKLRQLLEPFKVLEISTQCLGLELFFAVTKEGSIEGKEEWRR